MPEQKLQKMVMSVSALPGEQLDRRQLQADVEAAVAAAREQARGGEVRAELKQTMPGATEWLVFWWIVAPFALETYKFVLKQLEKKYFVEPAEDEGGESEQAGGGAGGQD